MSHAQGIFEYTADVYHADPCPKPSLSASIAHILCSQSPAHARARPSCPEPGPRP